MNPNAGDVQAPATPVTPGAARKAHVYQEEWEMDEGAYGRKGTPRVKPYSMCSLYIIYLLFLLSRVVFEKLPLFVFYLT